jgi:hypothetical protein
MNPVGQATRSASGDVLLTVEESRYWVPFAEADRIGNGVAARVLSSDDAYAGRLYVNRKGASIIVELKDGSYHTARALFERLLFDRIREIPLYALPPRAPPGPSWATEGLEGGFT